MTFNLYWSSSIFFPHPNAKIKKVINNPNFLYQTVWSIMVPERFNFI